jgi:hypothetical protein
MRRLQVTLALLLASLFVIGVILFAKRSEFRRRGDPATFDRLKPDTEDERAWASDEFLELNSA